MTILLGIMLAALAMLVPALRWRCVPLAIAALITGTISPLTLSWHLAIFLCGFWSVAPQRAARHYPVAMLMAFVLCAAAWVITTAALFCFALLAYHLLAEIKRLLGRIAQLRSDLELQKQLIAKLRASPPELSRDKPAKAV